jgi:hypothetical protein
MIIMTGYFNNGQFPKFLSDKINTFWHVVTSWLKVMVEGCAGRRSTSYRFVGSYPIQHRAY